MKITIITPATAQRSGFVAPTLGRFRGELRPQGGFSAATGYDVLAGDAGVLGHRPWSPPIT